MPRGKPVDELQSRTIARKAAEQASSKMDAFDGNGPQLWNAATIASATPTLSADLRGLTGGGKTIPPEVRGVFLTFYIAVQGAEKALYVSSSAASNGAASTPRILTHNDHDITAWLGVPVGTDGKVKLYQASGANINSVSVWVTAWWV